jgi:hypothetical protein
MPEWVKKKAWLWNSFEYNQMTKDIIITDQLLALLQSIGYSIIVNAK